MKTSKLFQKALLIWLNAIHSKPKCLLFISVLFILTVNYGCEEDKDVNKECGEWSLFTNSYLDCTNPENVTVYRNVGTGKTSVFYSLISSNVCYNNMVINTYVSTKIMDFPDATVTANFKAGNNTPWDYEIILTGAGANRIAWVGSGEYNIKPYFNDDNSGVFEQRVTIKFNSKATSTDDWSFYVDTLKPVILIRNNYYPDTR